MNKEANITVVNEKLNVIGYEVNNIKNLIYTIRGKQVMLDSDVAMLYHYETKKINQTVKRNIQRFPEKFCFQLTQDELENMWSQIVTTSKLEYNVSSISILMLLYPIFFEFSIISKISFFIICFLYIICFPSNIHAPL